MILSNHDVTCPTCSANNKCELQSLANTLGVDPDALPSILVKKLQMIPVYPLSETPKMYFLWALYNRV
jgi:predicted molibdopterin-dependent oxidoreductase YjgC